jgi:hypothetical protein
MTGFSESNEYKRTQGSEVTAAVLSIALLGRAPTAEEYLATVGKADLGMGVAALAAQILDSAEYATHLGS